MKIFLLAVIFSVTVHSVSAQDTVKPYLIHTSTKPSSLTLSQTEWYYSLIQDVMLNANTAARNNTDPIFYVYDTVMRGFAAAITSNEARLLAELPGVVSVQEDVTGYRLHTTRSPDFLGLPESFSSGVNNLEGEERVIMGVLDTGIWPESVSFDDVGFSDIPPNWKGKCVSGDRFNARATCNKKLIGARYFISGALTSAKLSRANYISPRDKEGHGTHCASTAVGSPVHNANLFGFANGTARGMAPKARLSVYKVCWLLPDGDHICSPCDIMAALEAAVKDGVHIISVSLGSGKPSLTEFINDPIAIGSFGAVRNGVFVACSAGNSGPSKGSVVNTAPWIMTVAAGSIDRSFPASITVSTGQVLVGQTLYANLSVPSTRMTSIINVGNCRGSLSPKVQGKIVVCEFGSVSDGLLVEQFGGIGMISVNGFQLGETVLARAFTLPAIAFGFRESQQFLSYLKSTTNPAASMNFHFRTVIGVSRAPQVSAFSARGPNNQLKELLKPDILAPGLNILASWPNETALTEVGSDSRRSDFNIISGTSMACPHIAGIAAILRSLHSEWTPAMIRSAMMTTADVFDHDYLPIILDDNLQPATPLAFGAGHVNPIKANDPGLVYDVGTQDYIDLLCTMNFTKKQIGMLIPETPFSCTKFEQGASDLNYPSFSVIFDSSTNKRTLKRTLTKVYEYPEIYIAKVLNPRPDKVIVVVEPKVLEFHALNDKKTYQVCFTNMMADNSTADDVEHGYIIWESIQHKVKVPMVITWSAN